MPRDKGMFDAVNQAMVQHPWLKKLGAPIALTQGEGPYESETFLPEAENNPKRGNFTVELRSQQAKSNPEMWPSMIASEGLDYLARRDPTYQSFARAFQKSMTPEQLDNAQEAFGREAPGEGQPRDFGKFLKDVQIQEYMRGYLFPEVNPGWTGPQGEGRYTPEQRQLLERLRAHLNSDQ